MNRITGGPDSTILAVSRLSKSFGGLHAVAELDFSVNRGEIVGLIGPNGAGKTTILNLITGFSRPDEGRVLFEGEEVTRATTSVLAHLGLIRTFQAASVYRDLSALGNVLIAIQAIDKTGLVGRVVKGRLLGRPDALEARAREYLTLAGLSEVDGTQAASLPYGTQRLLGLTMSIALEPKMLLLDEPAAGMNSDERQRLVTFLRLAQRRGLSILLIEHDVPLVSAVCDRVVAIDYGRKIADGTPAEVTSNPRVVEAYLGQAE